MLLTDIYSRLTNDLIIGLTPLPHSDTHLTPAIFQEKVTQNTYNIFTNNTFDDLGKSMLL